MAVTVDNDSTALYISKIWDSEDKDHRWVLEGGKSVNKMQKMWFWVHFSVYVLFMYISRPRNMTSAFDPSPKSAGGSSGTWIFILTFKLHIYIWQCSILVKTYFWGLFIQYFFTPILKNNICDSHPKALCIYTKKNTNKGCSDDAKFNWMYVIYKHFLCITIVS